MSAPPQINGYLLVVTEGGFTEDYDRSGQDKIKWQGRSGIFFDDKLKSVFGGELNRVRVTTLYTDDQIPLVLGDGVTYTHGGSTYTARVANLANAVMPGAPSYNVAGLERVNAT